VRATGPGDTTTRVGNDHAFPTALLSDAADGRVTLDARIRPIWPGARLAGTAFTVRTPPGEHYSVKQAALSAGPGDVIVIDAGGTTDFALWGDILARVALERGLAGLVVDGAIRDAEEIERLGFPVFAAAVIPAGPRGKATPGEIGVPIRCGGIAVEPGDIVYGDRDGVVVIPRAQHDAVLERARAQELAEQEILRELLASARVDHQ